MTRQPLAIVVEREPTTDGDGYFQLRIEADVADELRAKRRDCRITTAGGLSCGFARPIVVEATAADGFAKTCLRMLDKDETLR